MKKPELFIYFLRPVGMDGPIKIGCSLRPGERLAALMAWSPFPLEIVATAPGNFGIEGKIHRCFSDCHFHSEWFHAKPHLLAAIEAIKGGAAIADAIDLNRQTGSIKQYLWTDRRRRLMSYRSRASWLSRSRQLRIPPDLSTILDRWAGYNKRQPQEPTAEEFARLDECFADPETHFIPEEKPQPYYSDAERWERAWLGQPESRP